MRRRAPGAPFESPASRTRGALARTAAEPAVGSSSRSCSSSGSSTSGSSGSDDGDVRHAALAASVGAPARRRGASSAERKAPRLASFSDLPDYLRDNEFIVNHYRPTQSPLSSVKTLWRLHNETGNVWTHLIGFFLFVGLALWFAYHPPAPLAVTSDHIEHLWGSVEARFAHLRADIESLEASVAAGVGHLRDDLAHLEASLAAGVTGSVRAAAERAAHLGGGILAGVQGGVSAMHLDGLAAGLSEGLHGLQEGLHSKASGLAGRYHALSAKLNAHLERQLAPVVQWPMPRWPVYVYFAGACVCLLTSCVCHLLGCCQRHISQIVWRFDYAGIAVLIVASFYPAVYYAFLCQPYWRNFYLATTTLGGISVIAVSIPDAFQTTRFRVLRAAVFSGLGLWGVVPVAHQLVFYWDVWAIRTAFKLDIIMGVVYLCGAAIYASRVPERWMPGKLDIIGHSHQLWHIAVVAAALVHYRAILVLLQWRDASGGCAAQLHTHVPSVLAALQEGGGAPALGIDQVWQNLSAQLHSYVGMPLHPPAA